MGEEAADVIVVGGGLGGVAAALAVARRGHSVIVTEETDWLGGQLTAQAVPPDEHPWIERFGCTRSYRRLRDTIRGYYRQNFPLSELARSAQVLNPGDGVVSQLCCEPRVALSAIEAMLAPYVSSGQVRVMLRHRLAAADIDGDRVLAVTVRRLETGARTVLTGGLFLDATETGELLPLARVEYVTGFEAMDDTGEPHARQRYEPLNMQAISVCFAVDHLAGQDHTIERPVQYERWRSQRSSVWPESQLSWRSPDPRTHQPVDHVLVPNPDPEVVHRPDGVAEAHSRDLWRYRRIVARHNFRPGFYASDVTMVNWPMIDYTGGPVIDVEEEVAHANVEAARQLSLSLLYWMQTEAPRPDGGHGYPGLRLRTDVVGTVDGLARYPYVRESRRIQAQRRVVEQDVVVETPGLPGVATFPDSVGVGYYRIDLHPSTGEDNFIDLTSRPFEIPLGAILPVRVRNLIAAAKNIGTTHITNGCFRLHPVEWNVGEAAGVLAVYCLGRRAEPHQVRGDSRQLAGFQALLEQDGVELHWPEVVSG